MTLKYQAPRAVKAREPSQEKGEEKQVDEVMQPDIEPSAAKALRVNKRSRYIPKSVAHRVQERDQHQCTFTSSAGRRCSETCGLELDHIYPFALGDTNEASNLRLLCFAHNQFYAEQAFGKEKIESYFIKHGGACLRAR